MCIYIYIYKQIQTHTYSCNLEMGVMTKVQALAKSYPPLQGPQRAQYPTHVLVLTPWYIGKTRLTRTSS